MYTVQDVLDAAHSKSRLTQVPSHLHTQVHKAYHVCIEPVPAGRLSGLWYEPQSAEFVLYIPETCLLANKAALQNFF